MKYSIIFLLALSVVTTGCDNEEEQAQSNPDLLPTSLVTNPRSAAGTDTAAMNALATMDFRDTVFDFGTIRDGEVVSHEFEFTNNGKTPLIVSNASAACGCTVAEYPKEPIPPGGSGKIKGQFNSAGKPGHQEKAISLTTNSVRGAHTLILKGQVKEK